MRYSIGPRDSKGYGFSSFAKIMGAYLSSKCSKKFLDSATESTSDAIKTI